MLNKIKCLLIDSLFALIATVIFSYSYFRYCLKDDITVFWIKHRVAIVEGAIAAVTLILLCMAVLFIDIGYVLLPCLMIFALIHNINGLKGHSKKVFLLSYTIIFIVLTIFSMKYLFWFLPFTTFLCSFPFYLILKSL